jgi:hypothetical protein
VQWKESNGYIGQEKKLSIISNAPIMWLMISLMKNNNDGTTALYEFLRGIKQEGALII